MRPTVESTNDCHPERSRPSLRAGKNLSSRASATELARRKKYVILSEPALKSSFSHANVVAGESKDPVFLTGVIEGVQP